MVPLDMMREVKRKAQTNEIPKLTVQRKTNQKDSDLDEVNLNTKHLKRNPMIKERLLTIYKR